MTLNLNASMAEVTRLTRAGRLAEALARLQGLPQKSKSPEAQEGLDRGPMRMAPLDWARKTRFWKEAGCSHVTLTTNFNRRHHRRIPGRTMGDHLTALRRYHAAVADLL